MLMNTFVCNNKQTLKDEKVKKKWTAKKEHNNKIAYMHTYTCMDNKANSERTGINIWCQSIAAGQL